MELSRGIFALDAALEHWKNVSLLNDPFIQLRDDLGGSRASRPNGDFQQFCAWLDRVTETCKLRLLRVNEAPSHSVVDVVPYRGEYVGNRELHPLDWFS